MIPRWVCVFHVFCFSLATLPPYCWAAQGKKLVRKDVLANSVVNTLFPGREEFHEMTATAARTADDGVIKAFEVAASEDDPAVDDKPDVTLVENMLSKVPDLPKVEAEAALAKVEAQKKADLEAADSEITSRDLKSASGIVRDDAYGMDGVLAYYTGQHQTGQKRTPVEPRRPPPDNHILNKVGFSDELPSNHVASLLRIGEPALHTSLQYGPPLPMHGRDKGFDWHESGLRFVSHGVVGPKMCETMRNMFERSPKEFLETTKNDSEANEMRVKLDKKLGLSEDSHLKFAAGSLQQYAHDPDFPVLLALRQLMTEKVRSFFGGRDSIQPEFTHFTRRKQGDMLFKHADNCRLELDHTCTKSDTACCAWRSHTAMLYLSDEDVKGGDLFFATGIGSDDEQSPLSRILIKPKCGTLVAYSSGPENPHGVMPIHSGVRYGLAVWYTEQANEYEQMP